MATASRITPQVVIGQAEQVRFPRPHWLAMAGCVAVGTLTIAALLIAVGARSTPAASDEDRVRAVLDGMNNSYNRSDFTDFASHVCLDMLKAAGFEAGWYASRKSDGPTQITINSVDVAGGLHPRAVANVRFVAANREDAKTLDVDFLREDAEWKACRYRVPRSV